MGCDIHDYLEVRRDGRWTYASDQAFPGNQYEREQHSPFDGVRSYRLFGFLADVRNYSAITPIAPARGLPADVSAEVAEHLSDDWGCHSHSWLGLDELRAVDYGVMVEDRRGDARSVLPVGDGEVMSLRDFLGDGYFDRLELMGAFGAPADVRVVFAFDI